MSATISRERTRGTEARTLGLFRTASLIVVARGSALCQSPPMSNANNGWKKSKVAKRCNVFPTVWAAMYGCKGEHTAAWRYTVGAFGHRVAEYACPTCQAAKAKIEAMNHAERVAHLNEIQAANGVADYRIARAKLVDGVPTLVA